MFLIKEKMGGKELPSKLPLDYVPFSLRSTLAKSSGTQDSVGAAKVAISPRKDSLSSIPIQPIAAPISLGYGIFNVII